MWRNGLCQQSSIANSSSAMKEIPWHPLPSPTQKDVGLILCMLSWLLWVHGLNSYAPNQPTNQTIKEDKDTIVLQAPSTSSFDPVSTHLLKWWNDHWLTCDVDIPLGLRCLVSCSLYSDRFWVSGLNKPLWWGSTDYWSIGRKGV